MPPTPSDIVIFDSFSILSDVLTASSADIKLIESIEMSSLNGLPPLDVI